MARPQAKPLPSMPTLSNLLAQVLEAGTSPLELLAYATALDAVAQKGSATMAESLWFQAVDSTDALAVHDLAARMVREYRL